jgi:hypothetical protein
MFNRKEFVIRLEFFIRHWRSVGADLLIQKPNELEFIANLLWSNALEVLWKIRLTNSIQIGIENSKEYKTFCQLLTIGLNQLNAKTQHLNNTESDKEKCIVLIEKLIKEQAYELGMEVEQMLIAESTIKP